MSENKSLKIDRVMDIAIRVKDFMLANFDKIPGNGLMSGKMGVSIFFYHLSKATKDPSFEKLADNFIDDIYNDIESNIHSYDLETGLAGIAWGFHYLRDNGFLEGDLDEILEDLDDKIYQYITFSGTFIHSADPILMLGYGFYGLKRLEDKTNSMNMEQKFCFNRLVTLITDVIQQKIEEDSTILKEPGAFSLYYMLPLYLVFLSEAERIGVYQNKIEKIIQFLNPLVLSTFPQFAGNRMYMLFAMRLMMKRKNVDIWKSHAGRLLDSLDPNEMVTRELLEKQITLAYGKAGVWMLLEAYNHYFPEETIKFDKESFLTQMTESEFWHELDEKKSVLYGIPLGIPGIGCLILRINSK